MGGSGAGKTTLLNILCGFAVGKVEGEVLINGKPLNPRKMKKISNLVPQHDVLIPVLTAREMLQYAADLRIPNKQDRLPMVNSLLQVLSLEQCADVLCGDENLKGLSGGQRKRVSVGLELLTNPAVLLLDEPTSGLDSKVAEDVVGLLQQISKSGRTVICTIHQPNFQIFSMFNKLVMLHKGRMVYNYKVSDLDDYLKNGLANPVPEYTNPVDHFMTVLNSTSGKVVKDLVEDKDKQEDVQESAPQYTPDEFAQKFKDYIADSNDNRDPANANNERRISQTDANLRAWDGESSPKLVPFYQQFFTLVRRTLKTYRRDKKQMFAKIVQQIFIGLILGSIYYQMEPAQSRIQDRQSVLFMILLFNGMSTVMQTVSAMPMEKAIVLREYRNGYYNPNAFFLARSFVIFVLQLCYTLLHTSIVYPLVGFQPYAENFFTFYAALTLTALTGASLGFTVGTFFPTIEAAMAIVPVAIMPLTLFSGLLISPENIPDYWIWLYYLSFFQYPYQIFIVNEFEDLTFNACDYRKGEYCPLGPCYDETQSVNPLLLAPGNCSGMKLIDKLGYDVDEKPMNFGILVGYYFLFLFFGWLGLRRFLSRRT